jgi:hypothetical protein
LPSVIVIDVVPSFALTFVTSTLVTSIVLTTVRTLPVKVRSALSVISLEAPASNTRVLVKSETTKSLPAVTVRLSSTVTVPPLESSVRLPVEVSISLSPLTPIWMLSIVAPPLASIAPVKVVAPVNVDTPVTLRLSSMVV